MATVDEQEVYSGAPAPMLDDRSRVVGSYADVVAGLRAELCAAHAAASLPKGQRMQVAVFGHGGRDTNGWLAVVEAASRDTTLRGAVRVRVCSCSWADDNWEHVMAKYCEYLQETGEVERGSIEFVYLKYFEEPAQTHARVRANLEGVHVVVQCEQGVDMFIEPATAEWLQDNYEDFSVHNTCMSYAESKGVPCLLLQTNSDLDLCRGIDAQDVSASVFGGRLQTCAHGQKIEFDDPEALGPKVPRTVIDVAVVTGAAPDKKLAFRQFLGLDPADRSALPSLYAAYIAYAASITDAILPVAGVLEVAVARFLLDPGSVPWRLAAGATPPPPPQWLLGRFLQPREAERGRVRVLTQYRAAGMDVANTFSEFVGRWMAARAFHRVRSRPVPAQSRHIRAFWGQLTLAEEVACEVRRDCPRLRLWDDGHVLLTRALDRVARAIRDGGGDPVEVLRKKLEGQARDAQSDYGRVSPNWHWVQPAFVHIVDFTCRMLEAEDGIRAESARIAEGLPARPQDAEPRGNQRHLARLLSAALQSEWTG